MKSAERHENEIGPKIWTTEGVTGCCCVCRERITLGQKYYVTLHYGVRRHKDCAKNVREYVDPAAPTRPKASGSGVRRRNCGHGYSGGDGMSDFFM